MNTHQLRILSLSILSSLILQSGSALAHPHANCSENAPQAMQQLTQCETQLANLQMTLEETQWMLHIFSEASGQSRAALQTAEGELSSCKRQVAVVADALNKAKEDGKRTAAAERDRTKRLRKRIRRLRRRLAQ